MTAHLHPSMFVSPRCITLWHLKFLFCVVDAASAHMHARFDGTCIELLCRRRHNENMPLLRIYESWRLNFINQCLRRRLFYFGQPHDTKCPSLSVKLFALQNGNMECAKNGGRSFNAKIIIIISRYRLFPRRAFVCHRIFIDLFIFSI